MLLDRPAQFTRLIIGKSQPHLLRTSRARSDIKKAVLVLVQSCSELLLVNERIIVRDRNKDPSNKKSSCTYLSLRSDKVRKSEFEDDGLHEDTEIMCRVLKIF